MKKGYIDVPEGQIHYRTEGSGEPLILLHQAPLSSAEFNDVIPILSRHYWVIAPDMLGHGNSDDPPREYEVEDFTRSAIQFMEAIGIEEAILAGNHTGSALALSIAVNYPERVKKLVLSGETLTSPEEIHAFLEMIKAKPMSRDLPMTEDGSFLVEAWERYKGLAPGSEPAVRFKAFIIGLAARVRPYDVHFAVFRWMEMENRLPQVKCPVLIFSGDKDLFFSRERMESAKNSIPNCEIAIIEGAGAMVCFQKPREWAQAVLAFLQG